MKSILCIIGTRPEAIKMAPIILELQKQDWARPHVLASGQHQQMLLKALSEFSVVPDFGFETMEINQDLPTITAKLMTYLNGFFQTHKADAVLVLGDTTTVIASALTSFYNNVPIAHIEAGLRSHDIRDPFPEEANRVLVSKLAKWHFVPTSAAYSNLAREGISTNDIYLTGNTVIDALQIISKNNCFDEVPHKHIFEKGKVILITVHRRETFGEPLDSICRAILELSRRNPTIQFLFPVHPNPNIELIVRNLLKSQPNIHLCSDMSYSAFLAVMKACYFIVSDSCGVQEEAPFFGKPVLVIRNKSERIESIELGLAKLIGTGYERIVLEVQTLLDDIDSYKSMARYASPFGDGKSAERIVQILSKLLAIYPIVE
jgi:UDP-N-acetylglucosamine 2-epimerase (non-hydrolysing)